MDSNAYGDDVEAEAKACFRQIFSGRLSVDAIVEILSRYKVSLVQREKSVCEYITTNLLKEYQLFPMYPERQLKIAAILFGSFIKHQFISSPALGMALGLVLDSLRKPADSKMFLFGSIALEQFENRLVELQISDQRSTHPDPELASVIESLSRLSSGNLESDASVSHPGPSQSFPELPSIWSTIRERARERRVLSKTLCLLIPATLLFSSSMSDTFDSINSPALSLCYLLQVSSSETL